MAEGVSYPTAGDTEETEHGPIPEKTIEQLQAELDALKNQVPG